MKMVPITLTKLEYFAGQAMQGIITSGINYEPQIATDAISAAKELIKQLGEVEQ